MARQLLARYRTGRPVGVPPVTPGEPDPVEPDPTDLIATTMESSVTRHAITWTFSDPSSVGYFVNGDPFVIGPVNITSIDPPSTRDICTQRGPFTVDATPVSGATTDYTAKAGVTRIHTLPDRAATKGNYISVGGNIYRITNDYRYTHETNPNVYWIEIEDLSTSLNHEDSITVYREINGSMVNPIHTTTTTITGYDSQPREGVFDEAYNDGRPGGNDMSAGNPLVVTAGKTVVSSKSVSVPYSRPAVDDISVLTVLESAPVVGSFRPPYAGSDKTCKWNISQIRWDLLPKLSTIPASAPTIASLESQIERTWLDHAGVVWTARTLRPLNNQPNYGREIANLLGQISLVFLLDYTQEQLQTLMVRYLQVGIDWYGITESAPTIWTTHTQGHLWMAGSGQAQGRKWPMYFSGLMLNDADMMKYFNAGGYKSRWDIPGNEWHLHDGYPIYQEEQQMIYIRQEDVDTPPYTQDDRDRGDYTVAMIGLPEWGDQHLNLPHYSGPAWTAAYRDIASNTIAPGVLCALIMGKRADWNWEPTFEYMDRWIMEDGMGSHNFWSSTTEPNRPMEFVRDMWEQYRSNYPPIWTGA